MANVTNLKTYAGFMMDEVEGLSDKLNKARGYYATMLADGAGLLDESNYLYTLEEGLNTIGGEIFEVMRLINRFIDELPVDEEKKGEERGEI